MNTSKPQFKLIIGLGNPDKKYQNTYHNAGFLFIDYLESQKSNVKCQMSKSNVYMNESGKFVAKEMKKASAKPEELLIAQDDSDIEIGKYKLSFNRGAAGHHGIESIMATIKKNNFWRLRIGIRPKQKEGAPRLKAEKFVLKKISSADKKILENIFQKAAKEIFK